MRASSSGCHRDGPRRVSILPNQPTLAPRIAARVLKTVDQDFPDAIAARKSPFVFALAIFDSSSSIASCAFLVASASGQNCS
jgi:hypothetical protein